ncbi:PH domain-containing protein [Leucobacter sp. wl10]|uniref:PH domain-containing protein n=1 Tax=Leucobacter sp. wl10 TaxID=2304677 RepID=UPI000E5AA288|nr:PH domain-containing protein [Leucobacter sp. wl10]RGE23802.1 hypothetical protein D1J51_02270 [Leucobacter sp. wl10]
MDTIDVYGPPDARMRPPALQLERRAIPWWMLRNLLLCGIPLTALIVAAALWESLRVWLLAPTIVLAVLLVVTVALEPFWRFRVHRWEITERATYASNGWLIVEWRVAPTSRIQTVDALRGPLEQLFGLSTLRVTTASSYGAISIRGLDRATAEEAAARLAIVAGLEEGDAT